MDKVLPSVDRVLLSLNDLDLDKKKDVEKLQIKVELLHYLMDHAIKEMFRKRGLEDKYNEAVNNFKDLDVDDLTPGDGVFVHGE